MFHSKLKETLNQSISNVTADLTSYVTKPGKDFSRVRKLSPDEVISYLISQGASSTKCEWLDFFQLSSETPSVSALNQRRSQLMPEAVEAVFREFNSSARQLENSVQNQRYQYVAADGSTISFLVFLVLLPKTISFPKVILQGGFTACTLMPSLIWIQKPIRMRLFSLHIIKMNFWRSVSLLTGTKFLTTQNVFLLVTEDIVLTTTWLM